MKIAGITDEVKDAARGAGLDGNQSALLKVAVAAPDQQLTAVKDLAPALTTAAAGAWAVRIR